MMQDGCSTISPHSCLEQDGALLESLGEIFSSLGDDRHTEIEALGILGSHRGICMLSCHLSQFNPRRP
jgi:hypothetical protein